MNAQDIWNEYRNSGFSVSDKAKEMILNMKQYEGVRHEIWLKSTGRIGLSELFVHAYYDQREDMCLYLLDNKVDYKITKLYVNPDFKRLNTFLL
jgi:hypothetical protein